MEKHVGQSSALQEIDRWSWCKFSTAGKHSVVYINNLDCLCSDSKQLPLLSQFVAATSYEVYEFLKIGELTPADRRAQFIKLLLC